MSGRWRLHFTCRSMALVYLEARELREVHAGQNPYVAVTLHPSIIDVGRQVAATAIPCRVFRILLVVIS